MADLGTPMRTESTAMCVGKYIVYLRSPPLAAGGGRPDKDIVSFTCCDPEPDVSNHRPAYNAKHNVHTKPNTTGIAVNGECQEIKLAGKDSGNNHQKTQLSKGAGSHAATSRKNVQFPPLFSSAA